METILMRDNSKQEPKHPSLNSRSRATWASVGPKKPQRMSGRYYILRAVFMLIVLGAVIYARSRLTGH